MATDIGRTSSLQMSCNPPPVSSCGESDTCDEAGQSRPQERQTTALLDLSTTHNRFTALLSTPCMEQSSKPVSLQQLLWLP